MATHFIRPDVEAYVRSVNAAPSTRLYDMSVPTARRVVGMLAQQTDLPRGPIARDEQCVFRADAHTDLSLRLFDNRTDRAPGPVMLYCHGGGWVLGDVDIYAPVCAEIARQLDMPVIVAEYRRAPEYPAPTGMLDCEAAARWIALGAADIPVRATSLVLAGDSCGGAYAISVAMALRDRPAAVPVAAQLVFYPSADLATRYPSFRQFATGYLLDKDLMRWFAGHFQPDDSDYRASPMAGTLGCLPPAVVVAASLDPLRDQARAYATGLASARVPVLLQEAPGMVHGFLTLRRAIPSAGDDLNSALESLASILRPVAADG